MSNELMVESRVDGRIYLGSEGGGQKDHLENSTDCMEGICTLGQRLILMPKSYITSESPQDTKRRRTLQNYFMRSHRAHEEGPSSTSAWQLWIYW